MNQKIAKIGALSLVVLLCSYLTYLGCYLIAETFFFDKFFYQKSIQYGYWPPNLNLTINDFGQRSKDISLLYNFNNYTPTPTSAKEPDNDGLFRIAIFGDSLVWGQGVRPSQRFSEILEKKLNRIRPTKVYNFGNSGDNIFDNYQKYLISQKIFTHLDLNVFSFFYNDFLLNKDNRYSTNTDLLPKLTIGTSGLEYYRDEDGTVSSSPNSKNYQAYTALLSLLPKDAIYFDLSPDATAPNSDSSTLVFQNTISKDHYLLTYEAPVTNITYGISHLERHPSTNYHQIYAEALYKEIITNPRWGFTNN